MSSIFSGFLDDEREIDRLLDDLLDDEPKPISPGPVHYPVSDERYKLVEIRGDWELYEFKITRERNWCDVHKIINHGIGFAFYDPDVDPMWMPPKVEEESW